MGTGAQVIFAGFPASTAPRIMRGAQQSEVKIMRRIIEGKIYDTKTATLIAEAESHLGRGDFGWWQEELYVTPKGRFFVYGEGHAMSRWAEPVGNMRGPGQGIEALTEAEALAWCERHHIDPDDVSGYLTFEDA